METSALAVTPELALPPELAFMSSEEINKRRVAQRTAYFDAMTAALASGDAYTANQEAQQALIDNQDADAEAYVAAHLNAAHISPEDNPELFDQLKTLIAFSSYYRQGGIGWNLGEKDDQGNYNKLETSGRSRYEAALAQVLGIDMTTPEETAPAVTPEAPTPESIQNAENTLATARNNLAALSLQRRRKATRKGGKTGLKLEEQYNAALKAYEAARIDLGTLHAESWQSEGVGGAELRTNVIDYVVGEHGAFTAAEKAVMTNDDSKYSRFIKSLAEHRAAFFIGGAGVSFVTGLGIGKLTKSLTKGVAWNALGLSTAVVLPAVAAGVIGAKVAKAALQATVGNRVRQYHTFDKRAAQDLAALKADLNNDVVNNHRTHTDMLNDANRLLTNRVDTRVHKDVRGNKATIIGAAALSGISGGVGFLLADSDHFHSIWPFDHDNDSTSGSNSGTVPGGNPPGTGGVNYNDTIPPNQNPPGPPISEYQKTHNFGGGSGKGLVDGYNPNATVEPGNGYIRETQQLAAQKGVHLTDVQATDFYNHEVAQHGSHVKEALVDGKGEDGYDRSSTPGDFGILRADHARWTGWWIHDLEHYENAHSIKAAA